MIPELMKRTIEGVAVGFGAQADFHWYPYLPIVNNSPVFTQIMKDTAIELGYQVVEAEQSPGGEDFAYYQMKIPGFLVWMGVDGLEEWHHPAFTLKEEGLLVAAVYFSNLAIKVLNDWKTN